MEFELKKWETAYIGDVAEYANNPNIAKNLRNAFVYPYTAKDAEDYIFSMMQAGEEKQCARAIVAGDRVVGSIGIFLKDDVYEKSAELGYWLAEPFWGQGIMSTAIRRICRYAFEQYDIVRIFAEPFALNAGSRRALEKAGFSLEGVLKNSVYKNGQVLDSCIYALLREDACPL